jgi:hypothetical protein
MREQTAKEVNRNASIEHDRIYLVSDPCDDGDRELTRVAALPAYAEHVKMHPKME